MSLQSCDCDFFLSFRREPAKRNWRCVVKIRFSDLFSDISELRWNVFTLIEFNIQLNYLIPNISKHLISHKIHSRCCLFTTKQLWLFFSATKSHTVGVWHLTPVEQKRKKKPRRPDDRRPRVRLFRQQLTDASEATWEPYTHSTHLWWYHTHCVLISSPYTTNTCKSNCRANTSREQWANTHRRKFNK